MTRPLAVSRIASFLFSTSCGMECPGAELCRAVGPNSGVFLWALGIAAFVAARGMLRRRRWA